MTREAPISLRLPPDLRALIEAYSKGEGCAFHAACLSLIERGLRVEAPGSLGRAGPHRDTRGALRGMCVHRVSLGSYCSRCERGRGPLPPGIEMESA